MLWSSAMQVSWTEWLEQYELPCLIKSVFGVECPGCGFQRATLLLLKGEIWDSVKMWPALLPLLLFLVMALLYAGGIKKISQEHLKTAGFICLIIILTSYLLKLNSMF